jgi:hypothetical protein
MRNMILAAMAAVMLAVGGLSAARAQDGDAAAIQTVIQSQIEAFLRDDFAAAFSFASPAIREMFGTSDRFGMMVKQGYPMVWRPDLVEFLDLREIRGQPWQVVLMRDANGAYHTLGYQMLQGPDGGWKIDGVQILREDEMGA